MGVSRQLQSTRQVLRGPDWLGLMSRFCGSTDKTEELRMQIFLLYIYKEWEAGWRAGSPAHELAKVDAFFLLSLATFQLEGIGPQPPLIPAKAYILK